MTTMTVTQEEKTKVEDKVKDLLRALELDVNLDSRIEDNRLYFNVSGPDTRYFLSGKEEVLRALSLLLLTYHQKSWPDREIEIKFDANNTMLEREKEVCAMAMNALNRLEETGEEVILDPLNPYERRIVHMTLKVDERIDTQSLGDGHHKRVKIRFK